ncbi:hypothetical protein HK102_008040, partial [Quaeritorhiza haematococci]
MVATYLLILALAASSPFVSAARCDRDNYPYKGKQIIVPLEQEAVQDALNAANKLTVQGNVEILNGCQ